MFLRFIMKNNASWFFSKKYSRRNIHETNTYLPDNTIPQYSSILIQLLKIIRLFVNKVILLLTIIQRRHLYFSYQPQQTPFHSYTIAHHCKHDIMPCAQSSTAISLFSARVRWCWIVATRKWVLKCLCSWVIRISNSFNNFCQFNIFKQGVNSSPRAEKLR